MRSEEREVWDEVYIRYVSLEILTPRVIHSGGTIGITEVIAAHGWHGAQDPVVGAVWRVERKSTVNFLAKYVRKNRFFQADLLVKA